MLRPTDRPITRGDVRYRLGDADRRAVQLESSLKGERGAREQRPCDQRAAGSVELIRDDRPLAVRREPGERFVFRWATKSVQAEVVPHDPGEQRTVRRSAVKARIGPSVVRRFDRWPGWNPQRTDARPLVQNLGDVATFNEDRQSKTVILYRRGAAATV